MRRKRSEKYLCMTRMQFAFLIKSPPMFLKKSLIIPWEAWFNASCMCDFNAMDFCLYRKLVNNISEMTLITWLYRNTLDKIWLRFSDHTDTFYCSCNSSYGPQSRWKLMLENNLCCLFHVGVRSSDHPSTDVKSHPQNKPQVNTKNLSIVLYLIIIWK